MTHRVLISVFLLSVLAIISGLLWLVSGPAAEAQETPFGGRFTTITDICCDGTIVLDLETVKAGFPSGEMKTDWSMAAYRELFYEPVPGSCAVGFVRPLGVCESVFNSCMPRTVSWTITMIGTSFPGCQLTHEDIPDTGGSADSGSGGGGGGGDREPEEDPDAVSVTLTAEPTRIEEFSEESEPVTLEWNSENADSCRSPDFTTNDQTTGQAEVERPAETTSYRITCSGEAGEATDSATVGVGQAVCECEGGGPSEEEARQLLEDRGIDINRGTYDTETGIAGCPRDNEFDKCESTPTSGDKFACTEVRCLPYHTFDKLAALKEASGCRLTVTGGTEPGHSTHDYGQAIVDLRDTQCLKRFVEEDAANSSPHSLGTSYELTGPYGGTYLHEYPNKVYSHFHVVY